MSNITGIIPYSEIFERSMALARDDSANSEPKFKGLVNDAYTKDIYRKEDWDFLMNDSSISCSAYYNTGTVVTTAASADITGTGTTWVATMTDTNGWKIKFNGNDLIYKFTYASSTTATISPAFSGDSSLSGAGYTLWRDEYSLASDFGRFLLSEEGGLKLYRSGRTTSVPVVSAKTWRDNYRASVSDTISMCKLIGWDSSRNRMTMINPASKEAIVLPYDYIKILTPMTEYTTGYISALANGDTDITGSGTDFDGYYDSDYTYYFRIDADGTGAESVWYEVSTAGSDTSLTLAENYDGVTISSGTSTDTYTISMIPDLPHEFHDLLIYLAAMNGIADQGDPNYAYYAAKAKSIMDECKMLYKSRRTSKQYGVEDPWRNFSH